MLLQELFQTSAYPWEWAEKTGDRWSAVFEFERPTQPGEPRLVKQEYVVTFYLKSINHITSGATDEAKEILLSQRKPDGSYYKYEDKMWDMEFGNIDMRGYKNFGLRGSEQALPIFSTIVDIAKKFVQEKQPPAIFFFGFNRQQSSFYGSLLKQIGKRLPGFKVVVIPEYLNTPAYILMKE